jgi:NAD(P)-dependent dehydrogenase (short-subunit alcohol dehydrogenase family)
MKMTTPVVLITGGLTGIGRATAFALARAGAHIVVSGRHEKAGNELVAELRGLTQAEFIQADVRNDAQVEALVRRTVERFGRLDAAVNNAGTEGQPGPVTEQTAETYAATFDTNVLGVLLSMKHELRAMQKQGSGSIVNISSVLGKQGVPGASVYAASKHAVEGLTKSAALEMAPLGIRVNAVAPGPINTGMLDRFTGGDDGKAHMAGLIPQQRLGNVDEVAAAVVFLALGDSTFVTGHSLSVDGGMGAG